MISSTARWRQAMLTVPDRAFFDLYRNYFGELPSPHNKQDMLNEFSQLLHEPGFRHALAARLTDDEIWILNTLRRSEPLRDEEIIVLSPSQGDDRQLHAVRQTVLRLQDRLWIWRDYQSRELGLNPLVAGLLDRQPTTTSTLVGTRVTTSPPHSFLGDAFLGSLAVAWPDLSHLVKLNGTLSKRAESLVTTLFAGLADFELGDHPRMPLFDLAVTAWLRLGLATWATNGTKGAILCESRLQAFAQLTPLDRYWLFAAAATYPNALALGRAEPTASAEPALVVGYQSQGILTRFATVLRDFFSRLSIDLAYNQSELARIWHEAGRDAAIPNEVPPLNARFLAHCQLIGLLAPDQELRLRRQNWEWSTIADSANPILARPGLGTELRIAPQVTLANLAVLLPVCRLVRFGRESVWEFDMARARRALARDLDAEAILKALSGAPSRALVFELKQRETEARAVRLSPGVLVEIAPIRLAETKALLAQYPEVRALSDQTYFIPHHLTEATAALVEAGLGEPPTTDELADRLPPFQALPQPTARPLPVVEPQTVAEAPTEPTAEVPIDLAAIAQAQGWDGPTKAEALRRIASGLIVSARQLHHRPELSERGRAQGLDFAAKLRHIDEAIKNRNEILELRLLGTESNQPMAVWPRQIKGTGSEAVLIALLDTEHQELAITVRKIIEVRRVQATISIY